MKSKLKSIITWLIVIILFVVLYKLPIISLWRHYNNGINAFDENNFPDAANSFKKAMALSDDVTLAYNHYICLWSEVIKKQKDLRITSVDETALSRSQRQELGDRIEKTHQTFKHLIKNQKLTNILLANLYYTSGKLFLLENRTDQAKQAFLVSNAKYRKFKPTLMEMIKMNLIEKDKIQDESLSELVLETVDTKEPDIIRGWKPF